MQWDTVVCVIVVATYSNVRCQCIPVIRIFEIMVQVPYRRVSGLTSKPTGDTFRLNVSTMKLRGGK